MEKGGPGGSSNKKKVAVEVKVASVLPFHP